MAKAKKATESTATKTSRSKKPVAAAAVEPVPGIEAKVEEISRRTDISGDTIEMIRKRAYELFQQRNGNAGTPEDDWFRAEAEILGRSA